jgi:hypothetical protein
MKFKRARRRHLTVAALLCWLIAGPAQTEEITEESIARDPAAEAARGTPDDSTTDDDSMTDTEGGAAVRADLMELSCRDSQARPDSWMDRTHSYLNRRLCEPAAWFDGFFGDDRTLEETPVGTFFRLRNEVEWDETKDYKVRVRLSANIELPGASERLRLLISRDEDLRGEFDSSPSRLDRSEDQTRIGLRYNLRDGRRSRFDLDGTVRVKFDSLNPRLRGRYRHVRELTDNTFGRFTQAVLWEGDDGFGTISRADWEWLRSQETQFRVTGQGTWSETSEGVDWRTGIIGYRQLNPKTAIRTEIGAFGVTRPKLENREYFVNFRYRRTFLRPWLFYELQPEHAWPVDRETGDRRGDWRFRATLEIQFESTASRMQRERRDLRRGPMDEAVPGPDDARAGGPGAAPDPGAAP